MRVIALACLTLSLSVTPAQADPPTTTPLYGLRYTDSLAIAVRFWQQPPPCHVIFYPATPQQLAQFTGREGTTAAVRSEQTGGDCPIWFSSVRFADKTYENRIDTCSDTAHELGHLLGYPHDSDPLSVMFPIGPTPVRGCVKRFLPRGRFAEWRDERGSAYATRPEPPSL